MKLKCLFTRTASALTALGFGSAFGQTPAPESSRPSSSPVLPAANGSIPFRHTIIDGSPDLTRPAKSVGDMNGDGFIDIVCGGSTGLFWYEYPTWTKHVIDPFKVADDFGFCVDMQVGDINGDGRLDVIVGDYKRTHTVLWYENPGPKAAASGPWKSHLLHTFKAHYNHDVELGDFNRDGRLDVLLRAPNGLTELLFQKTPDLWTPVMICQEPGEGSALADMDGDSDLDVVQANYWLECPADPIKGVWHKHTFAAGWSNRIGVTVADLNRDGRPDIVMAPAESAGRLSWFEAPSDPRAGAWKEHTICPDVDYVHTFKVADMNRDGAPDIVFGEMHQSSRKRVGVFHNQGDSEHWQFQQVGHGGTHNLRVADLGNDGDLDLIGANWSNWIPPLPGQKRVATIENPLEIWENLSARKPSATAPPAGGRLSLDKWTYIEVDNARAKYGDGDLDLVSIAWDNYKFLHRQLRRGRSGHRRSARHAATHRRRATFHRAVARTRLCGGIQDLARRRAPTNTRCKSTRSCAVGKGAGEEMTGGTAIRIASVGRFAGLSLVLLGTPMTVQAAIYFVSSAGGGDAVAGTTQAAPWRTLAKVNATQFAPGDSIMFKRGDTWSAATLTVSSSGAAGAKITFGAYGSGAKPVIVHEGATGIGIMVSGRRHVTVQDFDLRRGEGGVRCLADSAQIEILRVDVADSRGPGIVMRQSSFVLVDGCTVTRAGNNGILMGGSPGEPKVNHCTVQNCIVSDLRSNDGIVIHQDMAHNGAGSDFVLRNNICFNCPEQGFDITTGSRVLLEDNVSVRNRGGAIVVGHVARDVTIRRHFSQDEPMSGSSSLILQVPSVTVEHSRFLGPVNPNPAKSVSIVSIQIGSESQPEDIRLLNNVFLWNSTLPGNLLRTTAAGFKDAQGNLKRLQIQRLVIRNNVFASRTATPGAFVIRDLATPLSSTGFDIDQNIYHSPAPAGMLWTVEGTDYAFAAYRQTFGKDVHGVEADPKFVDAGTGDLRFQPGSPARSGAAPLASEATLPAPVNLSAPSLACTATTAVLTWDRPAGGERIAAYQVFCDGELAGETARLCFTARNLTPGRMHRVAVRSRSADGAVSPASDPIVVSTKTAGPVFNVRSHGARGDGVAKDTAAIQAAIAACTPGGTVLIPPGTYSVDHLELKSDLTLELDSGATLQFLPRGQGNYPTLQVSLPGPDGEVAVSEFGLITARHAKNLTLTGGGVINGNGESWWPHTTSPRPRLLRFTACTDVLVQGITLDDPPAWNTHVVYVDRAVFSDVKFRKVSTARGTNGDGLNPDSSRDVLIVGCTFANQDDSIALKAGRVSPAQPRRQRSCENITIRDCLFDGTLTPGAHPLGFAVGSETCGGIRHVRLRDCVFRNAASLANIKSNRERLGAVVEDIRVENCTYTNTSFEDKPYNRAPLTIDLFYYRDFGTPDIAAPLTPKTPVFRDICFKNIVIENPKGRFAYLAGLIEQPVRGITFENVRGSAKTGFHGENLDGITLRNVIVAAQEGPPFRWINVQNRLTEGESPAPAK